MSGTIQISTALVGIGLFVIAILSFAVGFADDNNSAISIANDPDFISLNASVSGNVSDFGTSSSSQYQSIIESSISEGGGTVQSAGAFAITPTSSFGILNDVLRVGYKRLTGSDAGFDVFFLTLGAMIIFIMGLYIYKTIRGQPD